MAGKAYEPSQKTEIQNSLHTHSKVTECVCILIDSSTQSEPIMFVSLPSLWVLVFALAPYECHLFLLKLQFSRLPLSLTCQTLYSSVSLTSFGFILKINIIKLPVVTSLC